MKRILGFLLLVNCVLPAIAADPTLPQPVATASVLDLSEIKLNGPEGPAFAMVTFSSNSSIVVKECPKTGDTAKCPFFVFQWENDQLALAARGPELELRSSGSSADGSRQLLDFDVRDVPRLQRLAELVHTVVTLGMIAPEDVNREVVQVVDTATRKSCFEWNRSFPSTYSRPHSAAISPSGEFVVIAAANKLSIYRLPQICEGPMIRRNKED